MLEFVLALSILGEPIKVIVREPVPAREWYKAVHARCGAHYLLISDYGTTTRHGVKPRVLINGQQLEGPRAAALRDDLSTDNAVYRISVQCSPNNDFFVQIFEGLSVGENSVRYRAGAATISGAILVKYNGYQNIDASIFWF